jgi:transcriptional regulator with GAF, ATPase, and Fis domain
LVILDPPSKGKIAAMSDSEGSTSTIREQGWSQPPPAMACLRLVVVSSADQSAVGRAVDLDTESVITVGREVPTGGLRVADEKLSRMHFRVTWDGRSETHRVGDAGSANGTYVNGSSTTSALVVENDVIRAGQTVFMLGLGGERSDLDRQLESAATSELPVLLRGETGVGKEVAAQAIHALSKRAGGFVPVNCGALPKELAASELFGHTKAAFSGAQQARVGLFQSAAGGTLFLDEIGELPLDLQPLLLRALQDGKVRSIGSNREESLDVRIVAATNVDLEAMIEAGRFRADLYARLANQVVHVSPLRERKDQILRLFVAFSRPDLQLSADVAEALVLWDYEHNVRELKGIAQRLSHLAIGNPVDIELLQRVAPRVAEGFVAARVAGSKAKPADVATSRARPGRAELSRALAAHGGNVSAAAAALGTSRTQLYRWLKSAGIEWRP